MKIKNGLMLKKIKDENIVMSYDSNIISFNGMISLNDTGAFIFQTLSCDIEYDDLLNKIIDNYEIDITKARLDLDNFLKILRERDLIDE